MTTSTVRFERLIIQHGIDFNEIFASQVNSVVHCNRNHLE